MKTPTIQFRLRLGPCLTQLCYATIDFRGQYNYQTKWWLVMLYLQHRWVGIRVNGENVKVCHRKPRYQIKTNTPESVIEYWSISLQKYGSKQTSCSVNSSYCICKVWDKIHPMNQLMDRPKPKKNRFCDIVRKGGWGCEKFQTFNLKFNMHICEGRRGGRNVL